MADTPSNRKTVAVISHDAKKDAVVAFCKTHLSTLATLSLIATGTTGGRVAEATGLTVHRYLSGPLGGDAQIAAAVAEGRCHAVIFIVDPLSAHPHEPDVQGLIRVCNVHDVPIATNLAMAEILIASFTPRS
jgi:methylglyoxal synthase